MLETCCIATVSSVSCRPVSDVCFLCMKPQEVVPVLVRYAIFEVSSSCFTPPRLGAFISYIVKTLPDTYEPDVDRKSKGVCVCVWGPLRSR